MVDSESVAVGGEVAAWVTDCLVVGEAGCEREQAQGDADAEAGECSAAVAFECELAFGGPDCGFDPLADGAERPVAGRFVFAVGAQEARAEAGHVCLELLAGEA